MANLTKTVGGKALPASKFAYVGDENDISTWHLPIDSDHIQSALDMFGHEKQVPPHKKIEVARKIAATAKAAGIDTKNFEQKYCHVAEHADFNGGWVEIFRAGDYGQKGTFSADDLDRIVSAYNPSQHEAPACVGHPADNLPAYGWASELKRDGGTLLARFKEVDPAFEDAVKAGRYKKRSAAFYLDQDGKISNLRHVAFLGAQPPEVKGLKNINFQDDGRAFTAVEFGEEKPMLADEKSVKDHIREFFAEMFGRQQDSATFSESQVQQIVAKAVGEATASLSAEISALKTQTTQQATQFSEREKKIEQGETSQRAAEAIGRIKAKGVWVPAFDRMGLAVLFSELAKSTATIEFGEGDQKKQASALDIFAGFMESLPRIVPNARVFTGEQKKPGAGSTVRFQEGRGVHADANSVALNDAALKRAREKGISFSEALDQVILEEPHLARASATAGAV